MTVSKRNSCTGRLTQVIECKNLQKLVHNLDELGTLLVLLETIYESDDPTNSITALNDDC